MHARLEIGQLTTFLAVSETGSFSAASAIVNRSQAAISQQIQTLEQSCGAKLFRRTARGARLTDEGHVLAAYARRIIDLHGSALSALAQRREQAEVSIGIPDDYATSLFSALFFLVRREFPMVRPRIVCLPTPLLKSLMADNRLDLAIVSVLLDETVDGRGSEDLHWVSFDGQAPPQDKPVPLVVSHAAAIDAEAARNALAATGRGHLTVCECSSAYAVLAAVKAGIAVAVLSRSAIPAAEECMIVRSGMPRLPKSRLELIERHSLRVPSELVNRLKQLIGPTERTAL